MTTDIVTSPVTVRSMDTDEPRFAITGIEEKVGRRYLVTAYDRLTKRAVIIDRQERVVAEMEAVPSTGEYDCAHRQQARMIEGGMLTWPNTMGGEVVQFHIFGGKYLALFSPVLEMWAEVASSLDLGCLFCMTYKGDGCMDGDQQDLFYTLLEDADAAFFEDWNMDHRTAFLMNVYRAALSA